MPALTRPRIHLETWAALSLQALCMWMTIVGSFSVGFASNDVVAIWPAAGFAVCMAVYYGWRAFVFIFAASFAYSLIFQTGDNVFYALTGAGNALAAVLGAQFYASLSGPKQPMKSIQGVIKLVAVLAFTMSIIAAAIGMVLVYFYYDVTGADLLQLGWRWFFSDFTGAVLVAPTLLAVFGSWRRRIPGFWTAFGGHMVLPASFCALGLAALYMGIEFMPDGLGQYPTVLLTVPLCMWLALRRHTPSSILLLSATVIGSLVLTLSAVGDVSEGAFLAVQLYGLVAMCTSLVVHASTSERVRAIHALANERQHLEETVAARTAELKEQVTANEKANHKLERLARTDSLTGIANRREFTRVANQEISRSRRNQQPLSVVMVDIDHFKKVNDHYGHAAGDAVLRCVASVLRDSARHGVDLAARLGGEEFACLLTNTDINEAKACAERLRRAIAAVNTRFANQRIEVTASLGVSCVNRHTSTIEQALMVADDALYEAKRSGRNQVVARRFAQEDTGD